MIWILLGLLVLEPPATASFWLPAHSYSYVCDWANEALVDSLMICGVLTFTSKESYIGYSQHSKNFKNCGTSTYIDGGIGIKGDVEAL